MEELFESGNEVEPEKKEQSLNLDTKDGKEPDALVVAFGLGVMTGCAITCLALKKSPGIPFTTTAFNLIF